MTDRNGYHPTKPHTGPPPQRPSDGGTMTAPPLTLIGVRSRDREQMPKFPPEVATEVMRFLASGATGNLQIDVKAGQIMGCRVTSYVRVGSSLDHNYENGQDSID